MNRCKHLVLTFVVFFLFSAIFPENASAYLDPGTGSYIFQLIVAALIGGLFAVKLFWKKIKSLFRNLLFGEETNEEQNER